MKQEVKNITKIKLISGTRHFECSLAWRSVASRYYGGSLEESDSTLAARDDCNLELVKVQSRLKASSGATHVIPAEDP